MKTIRLKCSFIYDILHYIGEKMMKKRKTFTLLIVLAIVVFLLSFVIGRYKVNPFIAIRILFSRFLSLISGNRLSLGGYTATEEVVVMNIRFPRILAAFLIGTALSLSGSAFQAIFRNPMVSPDLLGASSGAGFGAALALFLGGSYLSITLSSFCFGLLAVFLAILVSKASPINRTLSFVLAGVMISSLFSSATSFIKLIADTNSVLPSITYYLMGSLSSISMRDLLFASIPILIGAIPVFLLRWRINLLSLSESEAKSLGVNTTRLRIIIILSATLMTSASVAISGMIGWVGLVIPHFSRLIFGDDNKVVIPSSILLGGTFLLFVDNFSRILSTAEIPLGILTSFIGAPVFLFLIMRGDKESEN